MVIDMEYVALLCRFHFPWCHIQEMLNVSRSTLYRRIQEEGFSLNLVYSNITDIELDQHIKIIKIQHPNDGERLIIGHLRAQGVYVPRSRIRASIHRVDPVNTAVRRQVTIRRRVYFAEGPNSIGM